jgi:hypothetical protein
MKKGFPFISALEAVCFSLAISFLSLVLIGSIIVKIIQ